MYRDTRLVNWDPAAQTTVSDAEVEHVERSTSLWTVRYPFADGSSGGGEIATTRPETILADVALAVHPEDRRFASLIGRRVRVPPMLQREIPIIADAAVDPAFGTGVVKVTPAHDATDYEIGLRHDLPMPSIIGTDAKIKGDDVPVGRYAGMDRFEARDAIVEDLQKNRLIVRIEPYVHNVATSDRSGEMIEPLLSLQWFCRMKSLAEPALQAYHDGRLRFIPERWGRTYEQWLENIRDWNISRQIWWGHQLPVWYTPDDQVVVAETEEEARAIAREQFGANELRRDPDTLDTWFSSALWPFSILGWPNRTAELEQWYPSQVLITGWEIIFLWVARMVMLGMRFMGDVPFPEAFIAPLVFDAQGRKMSKSLGNAIDPLEIVQKYGADAFRMGMMRQMRLEGQELRFQEKRCEEARNFNNKIWNATRFALTLPETLPAPLQLPATDQFSLAERWILTRLQATAHSVAAGLNAYDFGSVAETLWRFIWYDMCDWYVEAAKIPTPSRAAVISFVLNTAMRLLHPIEPFITEEVWLALPHDGESIMTASWPDAAEIPSDPASATRFEALQRTVERLRNLRADIGLAPSARLKIQVPSSLPQEMLELLLWYVRGDAELTDVTAASLEEALGAVSADAPRGVLLERYRKEAAHLQSEIERVQRKLSDQHFVQRAPVAVVERERNKLAQFESDLAKTHAGLESIGEPV
ncbi:MAG: valine--tRNA ligase [Candidatus Eremiobacteraeota bacterium]|nr:valine--tRNA ligase [Candidatus Eremiobacteraeota bacterium]